MIKYSFIRETLGIHYQETTFVFVHVFAKNESDVMLCYVTWGNKTENRLDTFQTVVNVKDWRMYIEHHDWWWR